MAEPGLAALDSGGQAEARAFIETHRERLAPVLNTDERIEAAERGIQRLGQPYAETLLRLSEDSGSANGRVASPYIARTLIETVDEFSDRALTEMSQSVRQDEALDGLSELLRVKDMKPEMVYNAVNNPKVFGEQYHAPNFLIDGGLLAVENVKGLPKAMRRLESPKKKIGFLKGDRYEIEGGAELVRDGYRVTRIADWAMVEWTRRDIDEFGEKTGRTDIDIVAEEELREGGERKKIYFQFKRSVEELRSLRKVRAWVEKARRDLGRDDYGNIIFVVPPSAKEIPKNVVDWLNSQNPPIVIKRIPHLD